MIDLVFCTDISFLLLYCIKELFFCIALQKKKITPKCIKKALALNNLNQNAHWKTNIKKVLQPQGVFGPSLKYADSMLAAYW